MRKSNRNVSRSNGLNISGVYHRAMIVSLVLLMGSGLEIEAFAAPADPGSIPAVEDPALAEARNAVLVRDFEKAVRIWKSAAKRGNPRACYRLGVAYRSGRGVDQDNARAAFWFEKAAAGGDADAQYALGKLFEKGLGVESNRGRAMKLIGDSARAGHREAKIALKRIQRSGSSAFATADARISASRGDPRNALNQAIRIGDLESAREALSRGAPINGAPGDTKHWRPLILAIDRERPEIIQLLFRHHADPNLKSRLGEPALTLAIRTQNRKIVRLMLSAGANPDASSSSGYRPLMEAARLGLSSSVEDLLAAGASPKAILDDGTSAADVARRFHFEKLARRLRRAGAPTRDAPNESNRLAALNTAAQRASSQSKTTLPPIIEASRRGDDKLLVEIIGAGANPATLDPDGDSALHRAADGGHVEVTRILLRAGVDPDLRGKNQTTALMRAVASTAEDSDRVVEVLLGAGADLHLRDRLAAGVIHYAAEGATSQKLELLREAGASWTDGDAGQSLERAARAERISVVRALLEITPEKTNRIPALCSVVGARQSKMLDLLLEGRLPLDQPCRDGRTALMIAAQSNRHEIMSKLLSAGANPNQDTKTGDNPLIAAASRGHEEIVMGLLRSGAEVDRRGAHRMTALMGAASNGQLAVVRILLEAGADRRMRSDSGDTAVKLANAAGHQQVAQLIESRNPGWQSWFGTRESSSQP
ncbi:MAG: ankyrin repeat domain-containing protein [Deltaproteobacteria bacterium]|nr:ankyrin repeat domain-containing protein [Deltaproteobacteria bacterium]